MSKKESTIYNRQLKKAPKHAERPNEIIKRTSNGNMKLTFKSPYFYERDLVVTDNGLLSQAQKQSITKEIDVTTSATTLDLSNTDTIVLNLTIVSTITEISNFDNGKTYKVFVVQDETGGHSLDIDNSLDYVTIFGDLSVDTTANSVSILEVVCSNDKVYVESNNQYNYIEEYVPFKFTIDTTLGSNAGPTFQLPLRDGYNYNFIVNWGDGTSDKITSFNQTETNHTYLNDGQYQIYIWGKCESIHFRNNNDKEKLISVDDWGYTKFIDMSEAFYSCENLINVNNTNNKWYEKLTKINTMFFNCTSLIDISGLKNISIPNINNINNIFENCTSLTDISPLSSWDVSNVTDMSFMFRGCTSLTDISALSNWDVSNVTDMSFMFTDVPLDTPSYDALLIGWSSLSPNLNGNIQFDANLAKYTPGGAAEAGRDVLTTTHSWTINDAGAVT